MSNAAALQNATVRAATQLPPPPAVPRDVLALTAMSPLEHTYRSWGRLDELRADYIGGLIAEALHEGRLSRTVRERATVRPGATRI